MFPGRHTLIISSGSYDCVKSSHTSCTRHPPSHVALHAVNPPISHLNLLSCCRHRPPLRYLHRVVTSRFSHSVSREQQIFPFRHQCIEPSREICPFATTFPFHEPLEYVAAFCFTICQVWNLRLLSLTAKKDNIVQEISQHLEALCKDGREYETEFVGYFVWIGRRDWVLC